MYDRKIYLKEKTSSSNKKSNFLRYLFLIFIFLFTVNIFANIFLFPDIAKGSFIVSPLASTIVQKTVSFINAQSNSKNLENIVMNVLGKDADNYGVVIKNLDTGERYYLNDNKIFLTASLYKLWVMAVAVNMISNNQLKTTDVLGDSISSINDILGLSSDSAELTDGYVSHSIKDALNQMITVSDNYSAYLLVNKIGIDKISDFLQKQGFSNSKEGASDSNPISTAHDISLFLEKLNDEKLANKNDSEYMINLLKAQRKNSKLPALLPNDAVIAHKTGELYGYSHDAGIVYLKNSKYLIVVMSNTNYVPTADGNISKISKEIYDYFSKDN